MGVIDHGQRAPAECDWVATRAAWTLEKAFDALRDAVMKDVNAIKPHVHDVIAFVPRAPESFAVTRYEETGGSMRFGRGGVRFQRRADAIIVTVLDENGKEASPPIQVTPAVLTDGSTRLLATASLEGYYHPWQLSRVVLEPLFFDSH